MTRPAPLGPGLDPDRPTTAAHRAQAVAWLKMRSIPSLMAYDERLADQIRARVADRRDVVEKEMFGGIAFMVDGNMAVGVSGDELMVRVGKDAHEEAVARPGARIFDMAARPMRGWILVSPDRLTNEAELDAWILQGVAFAESLPPK